MISCARLLRSLARHRGGDPACHGKHATEDRNPETEAEAGAAVASRVLVDVVDDVLNARNCQNDDERSDQAGGNRRSLQPARHLEAQDDAEADDAGDDAQQQDDQTTG